MFQIVLNSFSVKVEWVAFEQEVVLERHWGKKRTDKKNYSKNPREMQLDVLIELKRVLKKDKKFYKEKLLDMLVQQV